MTQSVGSLRLTIGRKSRWIRTASILAGVGVLLTWVAGPQVLAAGTDGSPSDAIVQGDLNCNGQLDLADLEAFILATQFPQTWCSRYQRSASELLARADFDHDGIITVDDVTAFGDALMAALDASSPPADGALATTTTEEGTMLDVPTGGTIDLDVDSDNNNSKWNPARSVSEDQIEDDPNSPGKYVLLHGNDDSNLVPLILDIRPASFAQGQAVHYTLDYDPNFVGIWRTNSTYETYLAPLGWPQPQHELWFAGDMNCDGDVSFADISSFVLAVSNQADYEAQYPDCNYFNADCNLDDVVSYADINVFVGLIGRTPPTIRPARLWMQGMTNHTGDNLRITAYADLNGDGVADASDPNDTVQVRVGNCCDPNEFYGLTPGYGDLCANAGLESRCWYWNGASGCPLYAVEPAFPLNISLAQGFGPPDLPPRNLDPQLSSAPLVSSGGVYYKLNPHAERAMHEGLVDLVTGVPLLQEIDFELPFGGATFRHVRTYSENFVDHLRSRATGRDCPGEANRSGDRPEGSFWDWNGRFWMMSENPILLIDAAYRDIADWAPDPNGVGVRVCYFIPDAHHAIPFIDQSGNGTYVAPSWFDAILTHDGHKTNDNWLQDPGNRPTFFRITMQGGSITYTFEPHYEDLWMYEDPDTHHWVNAHAHPEDPNDPGLGLPYYGVVKQMTDQYGHFVEYIYAQSGYFDCHAENFGPTTSECCERCCQNCNEKGQLKAIKLHLPAATGAPPESGPVAWTLLYTYRSFGGFMGLGIPSTDVMHHNTLHSIHVYRGGDVEIPAGAMTLRFAEFANLSSFDDYDALEPDNVPDNWVLRTKYIYHECNDLDGTDPNDPNTNYSTYARAEEGSQYRRFNELLKFGTPPVKPGGGYQLLKASVTRQQLDSEFQSTGQQTTERTVYRYNLIGSELGENAMGGQHLSAVWSSKTCDAILRSDPNISVNELIVKPDNASVTLDDPNKPVSFADAADLTLERAYASSFQSQAPIIADVKSYISTDPNALVWTRRGLDYVIDRRSGDGKPKTYWFHRFQAWPVGNPPWCGDVGQFSGDHMPYHWPYRFGSRSDPNASGQPEQLAPHQPFHIMVVDTRDPNADARYRRRVVELNPAGMVLSDKTWNRTDDPNGQLISQYGFAEQRFYDGKGRLVMLGSKGWGCAANQLEGGSPTTQGLVRVFKYDQPADPNRAGELIAVGIKQGTSSLERDPNTGDLLQYLDNVRWIQAYQRDPNRPKLVTAEVTFPTPVSDYESAAGNWTTYDYAFKDPNSSAVVAKEIRRPPSQRDPNSPLYSPIEKYVYNERGNLQWAGLGSVDGADNPFEFFVTYTAYNDYGQPTLNIVDMVPGEPNAPSFPAGWARCPESGALRLRTEWQYDPTYGLTKVAYPNYRETHIVYQADPGSPTGLYVWEYKDVVRDPNGGPCRLLSPLKVTHYLSGQPVLIQEVKLDVASNCPPDGTDSYEPNDVISTTTPSYSPSGQITGMARGAGVGGPALSASLAYDSGGQVSREVGPDGTVTRYTYDEFARLARTFRGTKDGHAVWGTAPQGEPNDNMVLIEKRYYGEGLHDADELTMVRRYRDKPINQYLEWENGGWANGETPNEDSIGWPTITQYDWRMRPVWQTECNPDGSPVRQTVTWYDNLDRPVLVAEYGPTANVGLSDPNGLTIDWSGDPNTVTGVATSLLEATPAPISVAQNIYNARGLVEEARQWRLVNETPVYTATLNYYDYGNRPVEVHAPNAPTQEYAYDAKGRQIVSETGFGTGPTITVLARTDTVYDMNDRATETIHTEYDPNGQNPISSYTYTWYDEAGRVIATANYGTNAGTYSPGDPPTRSPDWPAIGTTSALVTEYEYDEAGRQSAVFHPDGTLTRSLFDGLGRLRLTTEGADDPNHGAIRRTAYQYDGKGRLTAMAAVLPTFGAIVPDNLDAVFTAGPTYAQVTTFAYDAVVYPATWEIEGGPGSYGVEWTAQSGNNGWISQVNYPATDADPCGQTLSFAYYSDGSVAQRVDSRGTEFFHQYDGQGRRTNTWIDDSAYFEYPLSGQAPWEPADRVHHVRYEYDDDGRLREVRAYDWGDTALIARNVFSYDDAGNLASERQIHPWWTEIEDYSVVYYDWAFADANHGNYNRLTSITYPTWGRTVSLGYDDAASSALSRVTSVNVNNSTVALYGYIGTSRRVSTMLDAVAVQSFGSGSSYSRLDQFGRVSDLTYAWATNPSQTIQRYQYGYDAAGNRTYARVTQANVDGTPHDNDRSYHYGYDALSRLVSAQLGRLDTGNTQIVLDPAVPLLRQLGWSLDNLGNWTGSPPNVSGLYREDYVDGEPSAAHTERVSHVVNAANQIESLSITRSAGGNEPNQPIIHDAAGNLVWDGKLFYQYDGFNRLVQVNKADLLDPNYFDGGKPSYYSGDPPPMGPKLASFIYDGLGRLLRTDRFDLQGHTQAEEYYYDGVRRIVEIEITDPNTPSSVTAKRQYVYGPGYVDEVICQIAESGSAAVPAATYYYLQDGNYNVTAVIGPPDPNAESGAGASPAVLWQYTYEPYGTLVFADARPESVLPVNRIGHQGLFFERFCVDPNDSITDPALWSDDTDIGREVWGVYQNRARVYGPRIGRFMQKDMNETALPIITAQAINGATLDIAFGSMDPRAHYVDGGNLYERVGSNPVIRQDASGLLFGDLMTGVTGAVNTAAIYAIQLLHGPAASLIGNVLILANLYAMATDPDYAAMSTCMPCGLEMLSYDIQAIARFGTSMNAAARAAMSSERLACRISEGASRISQAAGAAAEWIQHVGKFGSYGEMSKLTQGFNHAIEAHKLFEWRHAKRLDMIKNDLPSVILTQAEHQRVTTALQDALGTGMQHGLDEIWQTYQRVYTEFGHADWIRHIERFFE